MRRFFAPPQNFHAKTVTLSADETKHLRNVLRLGSGDEVAVFDGIGGEYLCQVIISGKHFAELSVVERIEPQSPESTLDLTLAVAVLKHDRFDLVVQKAVELGVNRLVPLEVARFDVRAADALKRSGRWKRIAMEATKQCGRARLIDIGVPVKLTDVINAADPAATVMFSEREGGALPSSFAGRGLTAVIGPVGGWDDGELQAAKARSIPIATLGGRVLRAETAAIAIAAVLQHRFGDFR
jgi:16S rRNA (uracil1498-N3)-methyltransferase